MNTLILKMNIKRNIYWIRENKFFEYYYYICIFPFKNIKEKIFFYINYFFLSKKYNLN